MKIPRPTLASLAKALLVLSLLPAAAAPRSALQADSPPADSSRGASGEGSGAAAWIPRALQQLAAKGSTAATRAALRRFAQASRAAEDRGLAYFLLGTWEYERDEWTASLADLRRAAETGFSLADFAEYYRAAAAMESKQAREALKTLDGFESRHPSSRLRLDALDLFAQAAIDAGEAERALSALRAERRLHQRSELVFDLGHACHRAHKPEDAAIAFEEVYYRWSWTPEARVAGEVLEELRRELGAAKIPAPSEQIRTERAEVLYARGRNREALKDFEGLLRDAPSSPSAPRWKLGEARCLARLRRIDDALDVLGHPISSDAGIDAERLASLADIYARVEDGDAMRVVVDQLASVYPSSRAYAAALDAAGNFYMRRSDWKAAAKTYALLAENFSASDAGREANWRAAWIAYLEGAPEQARDGLAAHLRRYPASSHAAAALWWLGRLAEREGATAEARSFYAQLVSRYTQSYYALEAKKRLMALAAAREGSEAPSAPAWASILSVAESVPRADLPAWRPCASLEPDETARPCITLQALGLEDVAADCLKSALEERPDSTVLLAASSRFDAGRGRYSESLLTAGKIAPEYFFFEFSALPRELWELLFPRKYWELVRAEASARGLDPYLVMGLIRQESAFNPHAVSPANARGLMQILPETVRGRGRRRHAALMLFNERYNIRFGTEYLKKLIDLYGGNLEEAIAAYHAGETRVNAWIAGRRWSEPAEFLESVPIPATRIYVEHVIRDAAIYRQMMTGTAAYRICHEASAQSAGKEQAGRGREAARLR